MKINPLNLFIEINKFNFVFVVVERIDDNYSKIVLVENTPIQGIKDNKISIKPEKIPFFIYLLVSIKYGSGKSLFSLLFRSKSICLKFTFTI